MSVDFLLNDFKNYSEIEAIVWKGEVYNYEWLSNEIYVWIESLTQNSICPGSVVVLEGDFSPRSIAILIALANQSCIIVPQNFSNRSKVGKRYSIAEVQTIVSVDENDNVSFSKTSDVPDHAYYHQLKKKKSAGLVLFSSGTSGEPKAAVHDFSKLLEKFKVKRKSLKFINFLLFDHWGGLNTMFHTLSNGGVVITVQDRSPEGICKVIEKYKIEVLPASPTFLNLLLISGVYKKYDLSSLKIVSYGTEPMPQSTLKKLNELFPDTKLLQTYGLIEVGVMRSKSRDNKSLWVKVGGEGYKTRVVDGMLQIKAESVMLGYLNAPSPFTDDGWFITGDSVETDGEYIKILGRKSELINVGGEKVYPSEVESIIQEITDVSEAEVYGEKNPLIGNIVCANVRLIEGANQQQSIKKIKDYCRKKLEPFKVPVKVKIVDEPLHTQRFKKVRTIK